MKKDSVQDKIKFQKIVMSVLFVLFIIFLMLSFISKALWAITGALLSFFVLIDYLFIITFFNGEASKKK